MSTSYSAHTIIGVEIENAKSLFDALLEGQKIEKFGCEKDGCSAQRSHNFCFECGKPTIEIITPDHINVDDYSVWEWIEKINKRGHFHAATDHNQSKCKLYVGYGIGVAGYSDDYAKQNHVLGYQGDIPTLIHELKEFLNQEFGDYWEWDEKKFGMWTILSRGW